MIMDTTVFDIERIPIPNCDDTVTNIEGQLPLKW